ncbi:hypothetical protein ncot_16435 [Nocardioides sp. JQ2195]|uniref:hypothetical protein n=1 Tax=Nocardioides sp. JQ2195 TaxID=2592334 RepID=UPI00143E4ACF|nr:hypothetical protein [Nocardioides sp. JQ2195]QIX28003.1 hypothetical protein ncot_16435 [Nocardioides sp. JQ2195]
MSTEHAIAIAATFVWLGMVLAISFIEAPLKFRAPGVTIPLGLGIGRLVFRALNAVESVLAVVMLLALLIDHEEGSKLAVAALAAIVLLVQVVAVRPSLTKRSDAVLARPSSDAPRSHLHWVYVALEVVKVLVLVATGIILLAEV